MSETTSPLPTTFQHSLLILSLAFYVSLNFLNNFMMRLHREPRSKCTSAGRVTSRLLLSFLFLSTPVTSTRDQLRQQQHQIPIFAPSTPEQPHKAPQNNEHIFVGWHGSLHIDSRNNLRFSHYGMCTTMATWIGRLYTADTMFRSLSRQCG